MKSVSLASLSLIVLSLLAGGCQSKILEENKSLWAQNRELQAQLADSNERMKATPDNSAQLASMQAEIAKRDQEIADLQASLRQPGPGGAAANPGLSGIDAKYDAK